MSLSDFHDGAHGCQGQPSRSHNGIRKQWRENETLASSRESLSLDAAFFGKQ